MDLNIEPSSMASWKLKIVLFGSLRVFSFRTMFPSRQGILKAVEPISLLKEVFLLIFEFVRMVRSILIRWLKHARSLEARMLELSVESSDAIEAMFDAVKIWRRSIFPEARRWTWWAILPLEQKFSIVRYE